MGEATAPEDDQAQAVGGLSPDPWFGLGMARFWTSLQGNDRIVGWSRYSGGFYAPLSAAPLMTTTEYPAS